MITPASGALSSSGPGAGGTALSVTCGLQRVSLLAGLLAAVGIDLLLDELPVGLGTVLEAGQALILTLGPHH